MEPESTVRMRLLGEGRLSWSRYERVGDRYGTVGLFRGGDEAIVLDVAGLPARGSLVAEVTEVRESQHIGDVFRGVGPGGAVEGETVWLNERPGTVYVAPETDDTAWAKPPDTKVGIFPDDGRNHDWLDIKALYRLHDQTVKLYVVTEDDDG